tara:strand:- start:330 stop:614 length:285 start_codon:yes stop_codon:yes gene_type:complete
VEIVPLVLLLLLVVDMVEHILHRVVTPVDLVVEEDSQVLMVVTEHQIKEIVAEMVEVVLGLVQAAAVDMAALVKLAQQAMEILEIVLLMVEMVV